MAETVASLLTPSAPSGISVISLAGTGAEKILTGLFSSRQGLPRTSRVALGRLVHEGQALDEVLLLRLEGACFEICCHGGRAPAEAILQALEDRGARIEPWSARVPRKTLDHDLFEGLLQSKGPMQAAVLARLYSGSLKEAFRSIERSLRMGGEALEPARRLLDSFATGRYLHQPPKVVIAGPVNAGKSTLFNAVLGERRVITSSIPGTTRDPVECLFLLHGFPVRLFDLPGMEGEPASPLSQQALDAAALRQADADLILHVESAMDRRTFDLSKPALKVINKSDLMEKALLENLEKNAPGRMVLSALKEHGIEPLLHRMSALLGFPKMVEGDQIYLFNKKQVMLVKKAVAALEGRLEPREPARLLNRYISGPAEININH